MQINKLLTGTFVSSILFFSCTSFPRFSGTADLVGHVCGNNGENVAGYIVSIGKCRQTTTDNSGNFIFENIASGSYTIVGFGKGWSSVCQKIEFRDKRIITYIQIESDDSIYKRCEQQLLAGDIEKAQRTLSCMEKGNNKEELYIFYKELVLYCLNPSAGNKSLLEQIINDKGGKSE